MTDQELKDIVAAVVAELEKSGVDFDYKAEPAKDGDLVFVIRGTAPNYQGVTVTWKGLLDIITSQATQAKNDAVTAKNAADKILEQVQSNGTAISNFVATSKTEIETQKNESVNAVKSVYQSDLNELKGDLVELSGEVFDVTTRSYTGNDFTWSNGWINTDGTIYQHDYYKHTNKIEAVEGTVFSYTNLRTPSNYASCICCYSGDTYVDSVSPKFEPDNFVDGEFTVPNGIDGIVFVSYTTQTTPKISITRYLKISKIKNIESELKQLKITSFGVNDFTWYDGWIDADGTVHQHDYYKHTNKINAVPGTSFNFNNLRSVNNSTSAICCYNGGTYKHNVSLKGDEYVNFSSGTFTVPDGIDGIVFVTYYSTNLPISITDYSITYSLSELIELNTKRIEKLEKDPLYGKLITCTGNSITSAIHSVPNNGYVEQIAKAHGMSVDNHSVWGGIIPTGHPRDINGNKDTSESFNPNNLMKCIHDTIADMDSNADIVIMSGSINDCEYWSDGNYLGELTNDFTSELNTNTFYGALESMCKNALQKWSGKPIIYVIEHRMTLDNTGYGQYYLQLHNAIVEVMNKWGISIVDLFHEMPSLNYNDGYKTAYTTGDGTHPNYDGYAKFYVPRVYAEIKKLIGI